MARAGGSAQLQKPDIAQKGYATAGSSPGTRLAPPICYNPPAPDANVRVGRGDEGDMVAVLLGSVLSLVFFSAVLAAEIRGGDIKRMRELGVIVGILSLVAAFASHEIVAAGWPQLADLSAILGG
jgi:hypothetical protein